MTPLEIEILLHYHCTGEEDFPRQDAPAVREATECFVRKGILAKRLTADFHKTGVRYEAVREATAVYVEALGRVPLPVQKWVLEGAPE